MDFQSDSIIRCVGDAVAVQVHNSVENRDHDGLLSGVRFQQDEGLTLFHVLTCDGR